MKSGSYVDPFPEFNAPLNITEDDSDIDFFVDYVEDEDIMTEKELLEIFAVPSKSEITEFIVAMIRRLCQREEDSIENSDGDVALLIGTENVPPKSFQDIMHEELKRADEDAQLLGFLRRD